MYLVIKVLEIVSRDFRSSLAEHTLKTTTTIYKLHHCAHVCFASHAPNRPSGSKIAHWGLAFAFLDSSQGGDYQTERYSRLFSDVFCGWYMVHGRTYIPWRCITVISNGKFCSHQRWCLTFLFCVKISSIRSLILIHNHNRTGHLIWIETTWPITSSTWHSRSHWASSVHPRRCRWIIRRTSHRCACWWNSWRKTSRHGWRHWS